MLIAALFTTKCGIGLGVSQQMNVQRKHGTYTQRNGYLCVCLPLCVFYHKKKEIVSVAEKHMQLGDHVN